MVTIVPPTYLYSDSAECGGGGYDKYMDKGLTLGMAISIPTAILFILFLHYTNSPNKVYEKELKSGTEQILASAHADAVNSASTVNLENYEFTSELKAKCDSLYYARKITRFIKHSGTEFLEWQPVTTVKFGGSWVETNYVLTVDKNLIAKDTNFLKLSNGYKRAVEQLAVQRRISKQK